MTLWLLPPVATLRLRNDRVGTLGGAAGAEIPSRRYWNLREGRWAAHSRQGSRMGRTMRRAASGSPMMVSLMGSQMILRPQRMAMSETWLMMSERTASAMWLTGCPVWVQAATIYLLRATGENR